MNGSKKMVCRASTCCLLLFCSMSSLFAEEQTNNEAKPSMDFLEFLGEWETEKGDWIDPFALEDEETGKLIYTTIETKTNNEN